MNQRCLAFKIILMGKVQGNKTLLAFSTRTLQLLICDRIMGGIVHYTR